MSKVIKAPKLQKLALVNGIAYPVPMDTTLQNLQDHLPMTLDAADLILFIECVAEHYPGVILLPDPTTNSIDTSAVDYQHKCHCLMETIKKKGCQCGGI